MNQRVKDLSAEARKLSRDELSELVNELLGALRDVDPAWAKTLIPTDEVERLREFERARLDASDRLRTLMAAVHADAASRGLTEVELDRLLADES